MLNNDNNFLDFLKNNKGKELLQAGISGDNSLFRKILTEMKKETDNVEIKEILNKLNLPNDNIMEIVSEDEISNRFNNYEVDVNTIPIGLAWVKTNIKMENLILPNHVLNVIEEFIEDQQYNEKYLANGLFPRNKMLLFGPPGNGKTVLTKAIANRMDCPLFYVRYDALMSDKPGETSRRLYSVFEYVKNIRCIMFFDEIDAIGKDRSDANEIGDMKRVVSTLLVQLDDVPPNVMVLGATNHAEMLDKAILRRFHVRLVLPNPDTDGYEKYLRMTFNKYKLEVDETKQKIRILAIQLEAENFAEIEVFVDDVFRTYIREDKKISVEDAIKVSLKNWSRTRVKIPT